MVCKPLFQDQMTHTTLRFYAEIGKMPVVFDLCPWPRHVCPWPQKNFKVLGLDLKVLGFTTELPMGFSTGGLVKDSEVFLALACNLSMWTTCEQVYWGNHLMSAVRLTGFSHLTVGGYNCCCKPVANNNFYSSRQTLPCSHSTCPI